MIKFHKFQYNTKEGEKDMLEFRVEVIENESWNYRPGERNNKVIDVQFVSSTICDEDALTGSNYHTIFDDNYMHVKGYRFNIPWDFDGSQVYLVVARFGRDTPEEKTTNNWQIHGVFDTVQKAINWSNSNEKNIESHYQNHYTKCEEVEVVQVNFSRGIIDDDFDEDERDEDEQNVSSDLSALDEVELLGAIRRRIRASALKAKKKKMKRAKRTKNKKIFKTRIQALEI